ncbi:efflux RND transporter periplasmic adaptor subunit [Reichenbachiella agarivorans]|uniref:Efflux RND transporter periplasmic adaptor subunit n=1 Tax=Reichenbachiella agarivorans TaxID=2979464 RepID=A0ABY6CN52_9BACT|nr:efflux RND transporter periplasmic adaptor subunit [Reichenbachiella agarivorans]UXP31184.1 efflux RND transporter periplasmic adaptor subunit [Reichenbachiella agarivorans]
MKRYISIAVLSSLLVACGGGNELDQKKEEVVKLRDEMLKMKQQVAELESEIKTQDPEYGKKEINAVLVTTIKMEPQHFEHKIEVRGGVESRTNVVVSSEIPGKIIKVAVVEGQVVKKGQLLVELDNEILRNNIAELKTNLELATIVADKQANLWEKNIGTEMQYLEAKNNKESLERKLATTRSQLNQSKIFAPFSGSIDAVDAKTGEMAQPGSPLLRIVNPNDVHINSEVSERFIGKFKKGDQVDVYFPSQDQKVSSVITSVGQVINNENRTFGLEVSLPKLDFPVKPNQVVVLSIRDYQNESSLKVPTELIQKDNKGTFIYQILEKDGNMIAEKLHVEVGITYNNETEILSGLKKGQIIAYEGYRDLAQGVVVEVQAETPSSDVNTVASK